MGQCNTFEATATKLPRSDRQTDNAKLEASAGSIPALLSDDDEASKEIIYLDGIPLFMLAALIGMIIFLVTIEGYIVVTSLVEIERDLGDFQNASWILSGYQLGFVTFIVLSAKLSDIFGRKALTILVILLFTVFCGGCAAAQTMTQLIILRAFQGLGGGGCFTLTAILITDAAPPEKYGKYVSMASISIAIGTMLGPIVGSGISENTTWRWIFLFNVPVGAIALLLAIFGMPSNFPYRQIDRKPRHSFLADARSALRLVDFTGAALLLCAVLSFTACFMEADSRFPWKSAYVITLLIASAGFWTALLLWERHVTRAGSARQPVLPWRFFTNHVMLSILIGMALVGGPSVVLVFQIPQRFQLVNGLSNIQSGVRVLPFGALFPAGSITGNTLASKFRVPVLYLVLLGSSLQVIGFALLSTIDASLSMNPAIYGYLILCGFGCGMSYIMWWVTVPFTVEKRDKAVGMAAANQFRVMGSAMGLAIAMSVFNGYITPRLADLGIKDPVAAINTASSDAISSTLENEVRLILSEGYNHQMLVLCGISAAQIPIASMLWKRKQIVTA